MTPAIFRYRKFRILERNIHPELLFSSSWPLVGQCQMHLKAAHNPKPCTTTHKIRVKTTVYRNFVQSFQESHPEKVPDYTIAHLLKQVRVKRTKKEDGNETSEKK